MSREIIGYRFRQTTDVDYWEPIYPLQRGMIATAALMCCWECNTVISPSGGPGHNILCPSCFENYKLVNFTEGNDPTCMQVK